MKQKYYEKVCSVCGAEFRAEHGNKRLCPECYEVMHGKGRNLPRRYESPVNIATYEWDLRRRYMERYKDTIIAIGYADRQREQTLKMVGKVKVEL